MKSCHLPQHGWTQISEISQTEKDRYHMILTIRRIQEKPNNKQETERVVDRETNQQLLGWELGKSEIG